MTFPLLPRLPSVDAAAWTGRAPRWDDHRVRAARHARLRRRREPAYLASTDIPWEEAPFTGGGT